MNPFKRTPFAWATSTVCLLLGSSAFANDSELINMPTGRLMPDGRASIELSRAAPLTRFELELAVLPWLQGGFGVVQYSGISALANNPVFANYGNYKDKTSVVRARLTTESAWRPSVVATLYDPEGTGLFRANAIAASKRFGDLDVTVGAGTKRLSGVWMGAHYRPSAMPGWSFKAERDVIDYSKSANAGGGGTPEGPLGSTKQAIALGASYASENWGISLSRTRAQTEIKLSSHLDFQRPQWAAKTQDPPRSVALRRAPSAQAWQADTRHAQNLAKALRDQGFADIQIGYANRSLTLGLTHAAALRASQAAGRALQAALALGPVETTRVQVMYRDPDTGLAWAEFSFTDLQAWRRYFVGDAAKSSLDGKYSVVRASGVDHPFDKLTDLTDRSWRLESSPLSAGTQGGVLLSVARPGFSMALNPKLSAYLNGPAAFQYGLKLQLDTSARLSQHTVFSAAATQTLKENYSSYAPNVSRSDLPKVRSDFYRYEEGNRPQLDRAVVNHFFQPSVDTVARVSAGWYELAFGGVGAQWLYLPTGRSWAVDVAVDALRQREPGKPMRWAPYRTSTAIASWHQNLTHDLTLTTRAGRFLAGDWGVRWEGKRRFASGVEFGAWFSATNAKDFGVVAGKNYRDKGIFLTLPLDSLLGASTREQVSIALSPWTRDIAQMVVSPGDLYAMHEASRRHMGPERHATRFADVDDDVVAPSRRMDRAVSRTAQARLINLNPASPTTPVCRVMDPEIQGDYSGACGPDGLAVGWGVATGTLAQYEGEFVGGRKQGLGVKTWRASGDEYAGEFRADFREGVGTYTWGSQSASAGASYTGALLKDRRDGWGLFKWPSGDQYEGPWRDDLQIGQPSAMQRVKHQYTKAWVTQLAKPGQELCLIDGNLRAIVVLTEGLTVLAQPQQDGAAQMALDLAKWQLCEPSSP